MNKVLTKQLLLSSGYWVLNKDMVRLFGLETAFLLSNFAEAEQMMADKEGWFYQTAGTVEKMTTLTRHKQDQCIKQLERLEILVKDVRGMPAKRYFKIDYERLTNLIVNNSQTRVKEIDKLDCKKSATNKELSYKELNHKESTTGGDYSKIVQAFQNNGFGLINQGTKDILVDLIEGYSSEWVLEALEISVMANVRKLNYATAILKKWKVEGKDNNGSRTSRDDKKITKDETDWAAKAGIQSF